MACKKKHKGHSEGNTHARVKGNLRAQVIMTIVATDNTFVQYMMTSDWLGKCIHCSAKLFVTAQGKTDATIEHINPLCNDGAATDPHNLALACARCNNLKGVYHDQHAGRGGRADEVIASLQLKRQSRWRDVVTNS